MVNRRLDDLKQKMRTQKTHFFTPKELVYDGDGNAQDRASHQQESYLEFTHETLPKRRMRGQDTSAAYGPFIYVKTQLAISSVGKQSKRLGLTGS